MKIAIDIRNIGKGRTGDEVVFFELVRHLAKIDMKNMYRLLIDDRSEDELKKIVERLEIKNVPHFEIVQLGSGNKFVWNGWCVPRYCRQEKVDIYHTQYIIPFCMPQYTKIVTHIHDVSFCVYKDLIRKRDAFFLNVLIPYSLKRSDRIIAVSQFTKDEIKKYYAVLDEKVSVVYNASSMLCGDIDKDQIRQKYHLPAKYILMLGTMQPRKNIPFAIRAFAEILDKRSDIFLVLAGKKAHNFDGEIQNIIDERPELKKRIIFTGYVDENDKCMIYDLADAFIFPSLYEGFGVPILEAFHARVPVIASDIPPHREIAGEGVLYFDPENVDQCAQMLYDVLDDDRIRKDIVAVATQQKEQFSWESSARNLYRIYESLQ